MAVELKIEIERQFEFRNERTIGTLFVSKTGGPVASLITGREPHPTARVVCVRAGFRAMPIESIRAELPTLVLAEVASPVRAFLVQPHRLDMRVLNSDREIWSYRPDLKATVDVRFINMLADGVPFAEAAVEWLPAPNSPQDFRTLVVEVKDDADPRIDDPKYATKLDLAAEFYRRIGWHFVRVVRSRDLDCGHISRTVREIFLDALTKIDTTDVAVAIDAVRALGVSATYARIAESLADGPLGRAKLAALHVRRVLSIDLTRPLSGESGIRLVEDGAAILKRH